MKKKAVLIGGFRKTKHLVNALLKRGYTVIAVNQDLEDCRVLAEIEKLRVFHGDGSKPSVLEDADTYRADIAIALTGRDDDNLVICELCKKKFQVKKTVALISDPKKTDFFYKMGIDSVVCAITAISNIIEQQAFLEEMATLVPAGKRRVKIAEVPISANAPSAGKKLWEVNLPKEVIVGCILREDKTMVPRGDTRILAGDVLVLIASDEHELTAVQELTGR